MRLPYPIGYGLDTEGCVLYVGGMIETTYDPYNTPGEFDVYITRTETVRVDAANSDDAIDKALAGEGLVLDTDTLDVDVEAVDV
jgi:hypothetical protein